MLFVEPPKTSYDLCFKVTDIPVRIHPMFWLIALLPTMGMAPFDTLQAAVFVACFFVSILVHELGHAFTVRYYGGRPWITLYGFGGLASYRPRDFTRPADPTVRSLLISVAGPLAGFSLAAVALFFVMATGVFGGFRGLGVDIANDLWQSNPYLAYFLTQLIFINVIWNLINLIPVFPLDGGQVAQALFVRANGVAGYRQSIMMSMFLAGATAIYVAVQWKNPLFVFFFAYLAFQSYQLWQAVRHQGL